MARRTILSHTGGVLSEVVTAPSDNGRAIIYRRKQDVQPVIETVKSMKEAQLPSFDNRGNLNSWRKVAEIPQVLYHKWRRYARHNKLSHPEWKKYLRKKLNEFENKPFRVWEGTL